MGIPTREQVISRFDDLDTTTYLIERDRSLLRNRCPAPAYLEVRASNEIARRLYERAHFVLEGTWRDGFRDHDGSFHDLCAYGLLKSEYDDGVAHSAR